MGFINDLRRQLERGNKRRVLTSMVQKWAKTLSNTCDLAKKTNNLELALFCVHSADQLEAFVEDYTAQGLL